MAVVTITVGTDVIKVDYDLNLTDISTVDGGSPNVSDVSIIDGGTPSQVSSIIYDGGAP